MEKADIDKIEKIIQDRAKANDYFISNESKVYKLFRDLEKATYSDGELRKVDKELIAVGISVVINCESCMEHHIKEALNSGASEQQVIEAIEVGIEMGGGPATVSSRFALKVLNFYRK